MTNLKPGDPVRYKGGCNNGQHKKGCQGTVANNGEIYYDGLNSCSNSSCWEKIEERKEITFDNLQVGDVVVKIGGEKCYITGEENIKRFQINSAYYTKSEFKYYGFTILQPQAEEEMTIEQAIEALSKVLGKKIKIV